MVGLPVEQHSSWGGMGLTSLSPMGGEGEHAIQETLRAFFFFLWGWIIDALVNA